MCVYTQNFQWSLLMLIKLLLYICSTATLGHWYSGLFILIFIGSNIQFGTRNSEVRSSPALYYVTGEVFILSEGEVLQL